MTDTQPSAPIPGPDPSFTPEEYYHATLKFLVMMKKLIQEEPPIDSPFTYNRPLLVRLIWEHSRDDQSRSWFLRLFFYILHDWVLSTGSDLSNPAQKKFFQQKVYDLADTLLISLFMPLCKHPSFNHYQIYYSYL